MRTEPTLANVPKIVAALRRVAKGEDSLGLGTDDPGMPGWLSLTTSGTTGRPKIVDRYLPDDLARKRGGGPGEKWLLTYSPGRWAAVSVMLHCIAFDGELIVPKSLSPRAILGAATKATHVSLTPSMYRLLGSLPHMKQVTFGGEAVSQALLDVVDADRVTHVYASTELGDICAVSDRRAGFPRLPAVVPGDHWEQRNGRWYFTGRDGDTVNVGGLSVSLRAVEEDALSQGVTMARARAEHSPLLGNVVVLEYTGSVRPVLLLPVIVKHVASIELHEGKVQR